LVLGAVSVPLLCAYGLGAITGFLAVVLGLVALGRSREGRGAAIGGIVLGGACAGLVALLTYPQVAASRLAHNQGAAITDVRSVIQAELEYSKVNGDHYDTLECLAAPARCIPGYDPAKPAFLAADLASARVKLGYVRTFHAGPAPEAGRGKGVSPTSMTAYAYVATPESPGSSGRLAFCGDVSGRVCATADGSTPAVVDGLCAASCPDLR
jgi:hypothetical protein